jgi:nicotinamide-nucleotide amidase
MDLVPRIAEQLLARREWLATAESCTGGLIAKRLTDLTGSSQWFERGVVTYSNRAKTELLGVPAPLIDRHGAVSREVVEAMALGLLARAPVQWTLAVTGVAGPTGGSAEKPVGTVWLAWANAGRAETQHFLFQGDREQVREQTAEAALRRLIEKIGHGA